MDRSLYFVYIRMAHLAFSPSSTGANSMVRMHIFATTKWSCAPGAGVYQPFIWTRLFPSANKPLSWIVGVVVSVSVTASVAVAVAVAVEEPMYGSVVVSVTRSVSCGSGTGLAARKIKLMSAS